MLIGTSTLMHVLDQRVIVINNTVASHMRSCFYVHLLLAVVKMASFDLFLD